MCGRYQLGMTWEELLEHYAAVRRDLDRGMFTTPGEGGPDRGALAGIQHGGQATPLGLTLPWYNQAPGQPSPAVFADPDGLVLRRVRWGFPPLWLAGQGKDPWKERPLVNAKAEEAATKPTWRKAFAGRRCLVPTTGFYEWAKRGRERFPLHFGPPGGGILTLGGLWTAHERGEDPPLVCMSIVTTAANGTMAPVHDRMPVLLPRATWAAWLDPATPADQVTALCAPAPDEALVAVEANTALNGWKAAGPEVMQADWSR